MISSQEPLLTEPKHKSDCKNKVMFHGDFHGKFITARVEPTITLRGSITDVSMA